MKKLLFSLILSLLPIASSAIQYEYYNPLMKSNAAVKVNETVGVLTPPEGKGFGVLSALTNLQSVNSSIATNEYGIQVDTLGLVCPTEDAVAAAISAHNTDQSAHSYIQNRITVNDNAIAANADAIQKTREDFMAADTELQTQINSHAGELTTLRNDLDDLGDEVAVIEGKIPASTTSSNQLVNASQLTAESQDIRSEFAQADSELQQQINAHATAITNLEDGVDSINGKIPTNASTTNLLVSTSQLNTEIQDVRADYMADDAALQTQINGQATTIAGIQDDITGINSKISNSASSTNKLVSASELSATEQDIRADMNEADSQLQTQITAQAGSITTLRNDTDDLGDQVAGIEGKIPAAASSSNQLALNSQITSLQTQITTNTNNFTNYRTSAAQDVIDSNLQSQITNGLALKLDKDQGSENQGKILSVGSDGQITLTAAPGGGLQAVAHNSTLTGAGTDASPLGIASSVLSELADKADQTVVDALASTVSSIQTDYTPKATTTALSNTVSGIQSDYVSKTATAAQTIVSSLQMPELTVGTAEGTLNLSITAGVATIATNNGLDIISQTKFDTLPTTDDTTTWENALDANLVSKAQVASALSELPTGANLPILMSIRTDYLLNDMSWLRAGTFSWQSGDVYVAAYEHLASEMHIENLYAWQEEESRDVYTKSATPSVGDPVYRKNGDIYGTVQSVGADNITVGGGIFPRDSAGDILGTNAETDTVDGITITFYRADDGHKICLPDQEVNVAAVYENAGSADYYLLDTTNKQFKLPRKYKPKRELIKSFKTTGKWYSLYSDGWVEQGGWVDGADVTITLPIPMGETDYSILVAGMDTHSPDDKKYNAVQWRDRTATSIRVQSSYAGTAYVSRIMWRVSGYAQTTPDMGIEYEYYYVGNFEQSAIEQTAGITAETLNDKADIDLGNLPANFDYIVESQVPTADNGYTWFRKYKSGWVEQGGITTFAKHNTNTSTENTVSLPVEMADTQYYVAAPTFITDADNSQGLRNFRNTRGVTTLKIGMYTTTTLSQSYDVQWRVSGYAAE